MANGESIEKTIDRIEGHILRIEKKVDNINLNGCAHRTDDLRRIENLEKWKDRGIFGVLSLALLVIGDGARWVKWFISSLGGK